MESTENINLRNYWCIFKRHWLPAMAAFSTVVGLTYAYVSTKTPIYTAQGQLLFKPDKSSSFIGLNSTQAQSSQSENPSLTTEVQVIRSIPILQKTLDRVEENNPGTPITLGDLQQGLEISNLERSDIIQVAYNSSNPQISASVVNHLMNVYVENNLLSNRAATISASRFISAQLPKVKGNVDRADADIRNFKEKYQITDFAQSQQSVAANIERTRSQIDSVQSQLADVNSRSTDLQNKLGMSAQQAMAVSAISQSPAVQGVMQDLQLVQRQIADLSSRFREDHPIFIQLKDKEAQLKSLLQKQIAQVLQGKEIKPSSTLQAGPVQQSLMAELIGLEVTRKGLVSQLDTLSKQQAAYQEKAAILPKLEQEYREKQRELSAAQSTYETLLKSLQEIKVIENRTVGNVRIVDAARVPATPTNTNKTSAMSAGSLAGILIAAAVVYILEVTDKKIKTVKEARDIFEYTLLSTIPIFSKVISYDDRNLDNRELSLPVIEQPCSPISESYRMLQANLKFLNADKSLKVIVVTSSVPREGKSTTSANLAAVMSHLNYKVLVIDADIRHPSQHRIWQISNDLGLMNVIAGQVSISSNVIQKVMKNLYVLPTGISTSNAPVLLDSRNMATLIDQCPKQYDYVIIDTPPLAIAADASIVGKMADGVVLVTRPGVSDSNSSRLAKEYLEQSVQNILGIVVNGVIPENEPSSYYHYAGTEYEKSGSRESNTFRRRNWLESIKGIKRPFN